MEKDSSGSFGMESQVLKIEPVEIIIKEEDDIVGFDHNTFPQDPLTSIDNQKFILNEDFNPQDDSQFTVIVDDNNKTLVECGICKRVVVKKSFKRHYMLHSGEYPYQCTMCGRKAPDRKYIARHMQSKHKVSVDLKDIIRIVTKTEKSDSRFTVIIGEDNKMFYECTICKRLFSHKPAFEKHYEWHTSYDPGALLTNDTIRCDGNDKKDNQGSDVDHVNKNFCMILKYGSKKFYKCVICNISLNTMQRFNEHFRVHSEKNCHRNNKPQHAIKKSKHKKSQVQCKICGRAILKHTFREHMLKHSKAYKTYYCTICRCKCKTESELGKHFRRDHPKQFSANGKTRMRGVQHYICKFCHIPYSHWGLFQQHVRIHSCIKKYARSSCSYVTVKKEELHVNEIDENISTTNGPKFEALFMDTEHTDHSMDRHTVRRMGLFRCKFCSFTANTRSPYRTHIKTHQTVLANTSNCINAKSLRLRGRMESTRHAVVEYEGDGCNVIEIANGAIYKCLICGKELRNQYFFDIHFAIHKEQFVYSCKNCSYRARERCYLKEHLKNRHNVEMELEEIAKDANARYVVERNGSQKLYKCLVCGDLKTKRFNFNRHYLLHTREFTYSCSSCDYKSTEKRFLKTHLRMKHDIIIDVKDILPDGEQAVDPLKVRANAGNVNSLHLEEGMEDTPHAVVEYEGDGCNVIQIDDCAIYKCFICAKELRNQYLFQLHFVIHKKEFIYSCKQCSYRAREKCYLREHLKTRHNIEVELEDIVKDTNDNEESSRTDKFPCVSCGKNFSTLNQFNKHNAIHTNNRPYECPHCTYKSKSKYVLKGHLFRRHKISLNIVDIHPAKTSSNSEDIVKKEFVNDEMDKTQQIQIPSKLFKCEICQFTCSVGITLTKHRKRVHNIENNYYTITRVGSQRRYKCIVCGECYQTRSSLEDHFVVHVEEFPYSCPICPFRSGGIVEVRKHIENCHKAYCGCGEYRTIMQGVGNRYWETDNFMRLAESVGKSIEESLGKELDPVINHKTHHCEHCPYISVTQQEFLEHGKSHVVKEELPDNCDNASV
ncbi:putative zinc finger protein 711 [Trypoxylus dichotomus]